MECNSCGIKKPKNDARDFTKVVVENINPEEIVMFRKVTVPASMGDDTANPPKVGKYHNVILYYEANDNIYIYSSDGIPTLVTANVDKLKAALNKEILDREAGDAALEQEIEDLRNNPDVVDIVDTYADLQAYDTSHLGNNDIIRVLQDETHDGASTYYRWDKPHSTWDYIGEAGDYYTKDQVDTLLGAKQNTLIAGDNISISAQNVISVTGGVATVFYTNRDWLLSTSTQVLIYKDASLTTPATSLDIYNASTEGSVIIAFNYDKAIPNTDALIYTISESYYEAEDNEYTFSGMVSYNPVKTFYISEYGAPGSYDIVIKELQDKLTAGSNIQINDNTISATDTTYSDFVGATSSVAGVHGLVPAPTTADVDKVLKGDGTWGDVQPGMTTYFLANSLEDYASSSNTFSIYKDASLTTAVTSLEFNEVATSGPVQLVYSDSTSTEYYRVGFAYDNSDSYQMYNEMSYDIYALRTYTIYSIEDLGNGSFKLQAPGKKELQQKLVAGTNISIGVDGKTISATDTTYSTGTSSTAGITKLYDQNGQNTDGAVTQKHFTDVVGDVEAALQILNSGAGVP